MTGEAKAVVALVLGLLIPTAVAIHGQQATTPASRVAHSTTGPTGEMALIPGGTLQLGVDPAQIPHLQKIFGAGPRMFESEVPAHKVTLDAFSIDMYPVTNAQYKSFIDVNPRWQPGHISPDLHNGNYLKHWNDDNFPPGQEKHPVVDVSWYAAAAYCQWQGKRLPTEAEWEDAARGGLTSLFPWGNASVDKNRANYSGSGLGTTTPVGAYPANGYGLFDMAGNVWQFTADEWAAYPSTAQTNPCVGCDWRDESEGFLRVTTRRVIRGGSWGGAPINLWVEYRDSHPPDGAQDFVGFRCAMSAQ